MPFKQNLAPSDLRNPEPWSSEVDSTRDPASVAAVPTSPATQPASTLPELVRLLADFNQDELDQIPVVQVGARLRPRAVYVDLRAPVRREFMADGQAATHDNAYVPKAEVEYELWNRLVGRPRARAIH